MVRAIRHHVNERLRAGEAGFAGAAELVDSVDADGVVKTRITDAFVMIQFTRRTCTHRYTYL